MKIYARTKIYHRISETKGCKADVFLLKNCICIKVCTIYDDTREETVYGRIHIVHIKEYNKIVDMILKNNALPRLAYEVYAILESWKKYGDFSFSDDGWYKIKGGQNNDNQ